MSAVRAPSGVQHNRQVQTANNAVKDYTEQRKLLRLLRGAMKRAGRLPAGRTGRMLDFPVAHYSPRDEGPLRPSRRCHSFVVAVDQEGDEAWIVDLLLLQPAQEVAASF